MKKRNKENSWDDVLAVAAKFQKLFPKAVLVGGTAAAIHACHRTSFDADHVMDDLKNTFKETLSRIENEAGWKTARIYEPNLILGNFHGVDTGIRQLIREHPLETEIIQLPDGDKLNIPTDSEILRIKGALILKRNAVRDYLDFAALGINMSSEKFISALKDFDSLYPQPEERSALMQLQIQTANPKPYDLDETLSEALIEYRDLSENISSWSKVKEILEGLSLKISTALEADMPDVELPSENENKSKSFAARLKKEINEHSGR